MARRIYPLVNGTTTISDTFGTRTVSAVKNARGEVLLVGVGTDGAANTSAAVKRLNAFQCNTRKANGKRSECCA